MARRTKEEALATRESLLDAAGQVFCEKGVSNASLEDIAKAAGVTRGALYWHFKNKTDLMAALWGRTRMPLDEAWSDCCPVQECDPLGRIRKNAIDMLRRAVTDPRTNQVYHILFHRCEGAEEAEPMLNRRLQSRSECAPRIEEFFKAAIEAGQLPAGLEPRVAMIGFFSYLDGLIYNWFLHPESIHLDEQAELFVDIYIAGLRQSGALTGARTGQPAQPS